MSIRQGVSPVTFSPGSSDLSLELSHQDQDLYLGLTVEYSFDSCTIQQVRGLLA